jgi:orotate phosphoribosyltransferase-like protein
MAGIEVFKDRIISAGVLDPEGVHHEFRSGLHGQKLNFEKVGTSGPFYEEWVHRAADFLAKDFPRLPDAVLGVADGTNQLALDVAKRLGSEVTGLVSRKNEFDKNTLMLSESAERFISQHESELLIVLEDVGTTGSNSVQVAGAGLWAGAKQVEVVVTWQRRPSLERLDGAGIPYRALIHEDLPGYDPDDCRFCEQGWELIPR